MRWHGVPLSDENEATPEEVDATAAAISHADPAGILAPHRGARTGSVLCSFWTAAPEPVLPRWRLQRVALCTRQGLSRPTVPVVDGDAMDRGEG
jgi:hypothetical protein